MIEFKIAQKSPIFWATLESKFVAKNFQKSPNLVTLVTIFVFHSAFTVPPLRPMSDNCSLQRPSSAEIRL